MALMLPALPPPPPPPPPDEPPPPDPLEPVPELCGKLATEAAADAEKVCIDEAKADAEKVSEPRYQSGGWPQDVLKASAQALRPRGRWRREGALEELRILSGALWKASRSFCDAEVELEAVEVLEQVILQVEAGHSGRSGGR